MKHYIKNSLPLGALLMTLLFFGSCQKEKAYSLADLKNFTQAPAKGVETIWFSSENKKGLKGQGAKTNKSAKGDAFTMFGPGDTLVLLDYDKGPGIVTKIWSANSTLWFGADKRKISIRMYWDGAKKPAVDVPFHDFFGISHGLMRKYENEFFASPEGRSHNAFIPMPFKKSARIEVVNQSDKFIMFYYKINMIKVPKLADDAMYFHAYWNRDTATTKGVDYQILPKVKGKGRFLGANIGVIGNPLYRGSWFGEGETKIYLDGDTKYPSLSGTGTEDYIGTGWGQDEYYNNLQGSIVSNKAHDVYSFYRFHHKDPVYFHKDIKVTIQQIGNSTKSNILKMNEKGADITPVWSYHEEDGYDAAKRWLDMENPPAVDSKEFKDGRSTNFYRSDDVCATAYFYLDRPSSELPGLPGVELRTAKLKEKVYDVVK